MQVGYAESGLMSEAGKDIAADYSGWSQFNAVPYKSYTHGGRFVNNFANATAAVPYAMFEDGAGSTMPVGSVLAKDSYAVTAKGTVVPGPLFVMEKMVEGFNSDSGDWRYTLIMPNGKILGTTNGDGTDKVAFCIDCHIGAEVDSMLFIPEEYRN